MAIRKTSLNLEKKTPKPIRYITVKPNKYKQGCSALKISQKANPKENYAPSKLFTVKNNSTKLNNKRNTHVPNAVQHENYVRN